MENSLAATEFRRTSPSNGQGAEDHDLVDLAGLKALARGTLPRDSNLRMLIESEGDRMPRAQWEVKVDIYRKLMVAETEKLPSHPLS